MVEYAYENKYGNLICYSGGMAMKKRKIIYIALVLVFTACSIFSIFILVRNYSSADIKYNSAVSGSDTDKYLGYIFDDYNRNVNLDFSEDEQENSNEGLLNTISPLTLDMDYTADNMRTVRSERIISERAVKDEILYNITRR